MSEHRRPGVAWLLVLAVLVGLAGLWLGASMYRLRGRVRISATNAVVWTTVVGCRNYAMTEGHLPCAVSSGSIPTTDDPVGLFRALEGTPGGAGGQSAPYALPDLSAIGILAPGGPRVLRSLEELGATLPPAPAAVDVGTFVFIDAWGRPLHYVEYGSRSPALRVRPASVGGGAPWPAAAPPFEIWSDGPDGVSGTADDIGNW